MANICYFDMNIVGEKSAAHELVQMMKWEEPFKKKGLGRIYSTEIYEEETIARQGEKDLVSLKCSGDCAWSVFSSMLKGKDRYPCLESETERLGLALEVYSSEPGIGFQEHYVISKGEILVDEKRDYQEHWIENMTKEEILEIFEENEISFEKVNEHVNENGDLCFGGFGDKFENFQDLTDYFDEDEIEIE